ncbi:GNAT family N-acetyltransferase [Cohnella thailandensis]|uniref:GNAT family N-acetyltransferase n=1 Tax=Cohnella thailandensis TaxID=557557 RepID=A0A841T107_9BACL|nr:GNAT family N-acetyltransferase [Cohnella thailandensis]
MLTTRLAVPEDEPFLFEVYADTRSEELSSWGWTKEQSNLFLRMQYEAQRRSYFGDASSAKEEVVQYEKERVGRILTRTTDLVLAIVDISLLSGFRNRGFGTELIRRCQRHAYGTNRSVELHVLNGNPAMRLYDRLGFEAVSEASPYIAMKWSPQAF